MSSFLKLSVTSGKSTRLLPIPFTIGLLVLALWGALSILWHLLGSSDSAAALQASLPPSQLKWRSTGSVRWASASRPLTAEESCTPTKLGGKVVLVTGTGGFVGYATAMSLRKRGDGVLGLDNFNSYYPVSLKRSRADELEQAGIFTLETDLNDIASLEQAHSICKFTHILNLAAQAGVRYATKDPDSYINSNVAGFTTILEFVKNLDPKPRVVYASSSSVYGLNTKVPFAEHDVVDRPASLYAATKKSNEMLAHTYNHIYGIATTGLRFFTVYGPFGRPDMAAFAFANKIMLDQPVKIFHGPGGSELERDFTYIDDIVKGTVAAIDHIGPSEKPAPFKVYNLGNKEPQNVTYLVNLLEEFLGKKAIKKYIPMPPTGDVLKTSADVSLAEEDLGYSPSISLREGVRRFIAWYKDYFPNGLPDDMATYQPL